MIHSLTRGGQVSLHNFHMLRQVMTVTVILTALAGSIFWGCKTWFSYEPYERYALASYYWADIKLSLPGPKEKVTQNYRYANGQEYIVRSLDLKQNEALQVWAKDFKERMEHNACLTLWFMLGFFLVVCGGWVWRGHAKKAKEILSGTEEVSPKTLAKLIRRKKEESDLSLAGVPLIKNAEKQHILILGTTGSGKTNALHELLQQIRTRKQRAIIVDMTGVFIEKYYRPGIDKILNPRDVRSEPWSLWGECQNSSHLKSIASILIPANERGEETFWVKSSRSLFVTTAEELKQTGSLTNKKFFGFAADLPVKQIQEFYRHTKAAALVSPDAKETVMGVRSHLRACIDGLELFEETDQPFSIRDWVSDEGGEEWLFLSSPPETREEIASLMSLWTSISIEALNAMSRDLDRRLWVVIDELPAIKKLPKLHTMLAEVRQRGGCVVLGSQDMSLLDDIYGYNIVKSISNLCSTKVVFRIEGSDIAERMSKWLGVQEVSESAENISYGAHQMRDGVNLNENRKEKPTVHYDKIMKLPNLEAYLKVPGNYPVAKVVFKIHDLPTIAVGFCRHTENKAEKESLKLEKFASS
jgi:type IV conjugative transfer system coupling protein TraD